MTAPCYEGWRKEDGNIKGECCCSCRFQRPITGHPWNRNALTKGSIKRIIGYGCTVPDMPAITFFDSKHGMCEMYTDRNNVVKLERVK